MAFDGLTGDFVKAKLRSGNQYTSNGIKEFLKPLLEHYNQVIPTTDILIRGDRGFTIPDIYDLCELYEDHYVIRLKANRNLYSMIMIIHVMKKKSIITRFHTEHLLRQSIDVSVSVRLEK